MAFQPTEKQIKDATKEGGKKGQDLSGFFDMGGASFFQVTMEKCEGEMALLEVALKAANKEVDEGAEDRKGGAGHVAKAFFTANVKQVAVIIYVPKALQEKLSPETWAERIMQPHGGEVVEKSEEVWKIIVEGNPELEKFPLKMRDEVSSAGFGVLREKLLIPEDDDDSGKLIAVVDCSDDADYDLSAAYEDNGIEW